MANKVKTKSNNNGITTLLSRLTFAPQARAEADKGDYPGGRFKRFKDTYKAGRELLMTGNLWFLMFSLPFIGILLVLSTLGAEQLSYMISSVKDLPYYMGQIGLGVSNGASFVEGQVNILLVYRLVFAAIGLSLPIMGIGFAGCMHIATKLIWGEEFIFKKDTYGNKIPRATKEFFIGVKKYGGQMVAIFAVIGLLIAGCSNLVINFIAGQYRGGADAGTWILLILSCIVTLIIFLITVNLVPSVVSYNIKFIQKIKNSCILAAALIVPTLFAVIICIAPLFLTQSGSFVGLLATFAIMMFAGSVIPLMLANFSDYNAEKIITPIYEAQKQTAKKKDKRKK